MPGRPVWRPGAHHLEESAPGEEDHAPVVALTELPGHGQAQHVPVEGEGAVEVGGMEEGPTAQDVHGRLPAPECRSVGGVGVEGTGVRPGRGQELLTGGQHREVAAHPDAPGS